MGKYRHNYSFWPLIIGLPVTAMVFLTLVFIGKIHLYLAWIAAFSLTTFVLFGLDKRLAISGRIRIPENVLHLFTLLGGFIGQVAGRLLFRHKVNFQRHPSFTVTPIAGIILWALIAYLLYAR